MPLPTPLCRPLDASLHSWNPDAQRRDPVLETENIEDRFQIQLKIHELQAHDGTHRIPVSMDDNAPSTPIPLGPASRIFMLWCSTLVLAPFSQPPAGEAPKESKIPAAPDPGEPRTESLSGTIQGLVTYPAGTGEALQAGARRIPLNEVISIQFPGKKVSRQEVLILLRGGDSLFATLTGGDADQVTFRANSVHPALGPETLSVPLEAIRGIGFPGKYRDPEEGLTQVRRWFARKSGTASRPADSPAGDPGKIPSNGLGADRVLLDEGAELEGVLQKIDAVTAVFQSGAVGEVRLPLQKVRAVWISDEGIPGALGRSSTAKDLGEAIVAIVQCQDGSTLSGRLLSIRSAPPGPGSGERPATGGEVRLKSEALGEVGSPLGRVDRISLRGGRCLFLSDLQPVKVSHKPDLFRPWDIQFDLSATGDPLKLRGRVHPKGLGMHSHTRADFDLGGAQAARFQAVLGMDDSARPETLKAREIGAGTAIFRVHVDGKVAFEKQLAWSDPPLPVDIPVEGAAILGLELDYGTGFLIQGRGNWADARIIKK